MRGARMSCRRSRKKGENYDLFTINMVLITFFFTWRGAENGKRKFLFSFSWFFRVFVIFSFSTYNFFFFFFHSATFSISTLFEFVGYTDAMFAIVEKLNFFEYFWMEEGGFVWVDGGETPFIATASRKVVYWWHFRWTFVEWQSRSFTPPTFVELNHDNPENGMMFHDSLLLLVQFDTQVTLQWKQWVELSEKIAWKIQNFHFFNIVVDFCWTLISVFSEFFEKTCICRTIVRKKHISFIAWYDGGSDGGWKECELSERTRAT